MIARIRTFIIRTFGNAPAKGSMVVIWTFAGIVIFEIAVYNAGWLYNWYKSGAADNPEMRLFLVTVVCGGLASVIGFIGKGFIDKNNNGEPDMFEEESEKQ